MGRVPTIIEWVFFISSLAPSSHILICGAQFIWKYKGEKWSPLEIYSRVRNNLICWQLIFIRHRLSTTAIISLAIPLALFQLLPPSSHHTFFTASNGRDRSRGSGILSVRAEISSVAARILNLLSHQDLRSHTLQQVSKSHSLSVDALSHWANCFSALFFYECIVTVDQEAKVIWSRKWTGSTILFFLNRYLSLFLIILNIAPPSQVRCNWVSILLKLYVLYYLRRSMSFLGLSFALRNSRPLVAIPLSQIYSQYWQQFNTPYSPVGYRASCPMAKLIKCYISQCSHRCAFMHWPDASSGSQALSWYRGSLPWWQTL